MCRYADIKPGGEKAADKQELGQWCSMFSKEEPDDDDREWIDEMIEDIDADLERCFDTRHWPGEIETLGSAHLDAMMVAHAVRQERIAT